jgi:hypothetical protein
LVFIQYSKYSFNETELEIIIFKVSFKHSELILKFLISERSLQKHYKLYLVVRQTIGGDGGEA